MADRPILFSAPMVRALLAGQKTQTRRSMRYQVETPGRFEMAKPGYCEIVNEHGVHIPGFFCPYGDPGDRLWVRETWYCDDYRVQRGPYLLPEGESVADWREDGTLVYGADGLKPYEAEQPVWKPSIHMPRWASRILLEVTDVRVERLQAISRGDAMAEGCPFPNMAAGDDPRRWYRDVWDQINGAGAWDANPWCWAITFKRIDA